jgi:hypothetical protein
MRRVFIAMAGAIALLAGPSVAQAAPRKHDLGGVHLSWVRSPTATACPDASQIEADVTRRLGASPFTGPTRSSIEAIVSRGDNGWRAEIEMRGIDGSSEGSRTVTSDAPTCASLSSAAGLAIALMIDPDALLAPPVEAPPPPIEPPPEPVSAPPPIVSAALHRGSIALTGLAAAHILPRAAPGLQLTGDVFVAPQTLVTLGAAFLSEERASQGDVRFGLTFATLGLCYQPLATKSWEIAACAALMAGALHVAVSSPIPDEVGQRVYAGGEAGARVAWLPSPAFEMRLQADLVLPFDRHTFAIASNDGVSSVFRQPSFGGVLSIGAGLRY